MKYPQKDNWAVAARYSTVATELVTVLQKNYNSLIVGYNITGLTKAHYIMVDRQVKVAFPCMFRDLLANDKNVVKSFE